MTEELSAHTINLLILQNDSRTIPQSLSRQLPLHKGAFFILFVLRGSSLCWGSPQPEPKPPLCKRRWHAASMTEELSAHTINLLILQNDSRTIPQSLSRQLPLHKGAFFIFVLRDSPLCQGGLLIWVLRRISFARGAGVGLNSIFTPCGIRSGNIPLPSWNIPEHRSVQTPEQYKLYTQGIGEYYPTPEYSKAL